MQMRNLALLGAIVLALNGARAATFTVINTNDTGVGSLRWALTNAMASAAPRVVEFSVTGTPPHIIKVDAALPHITNALSVRGDTQPGYSNTPLVQILGPSSALPDFDFGMWSQSAGVTIRCVRVSGFRSAGILADGTPPWNVRVEGCLLDENANGVQSGGSGAVIGGTSTNLRNVIINNQSNGVFLLAGNANVLGNYIGVAADGVTAAGNGEHGIRLVYFSNGNTIRGATNYPQVISGNGLNGVFGEPNGSYIQGASDNKIEGNFIGTDATGMNEIPNGANGVRFWCGSRNTVGGTTTTQRNVIAGNKAAGVSIEGLPPIYGEGRDNKVLGNYIGLGADGETVLSNYYGVRIYDAQANQVGGSAPGSGNRFGASEREHVILLSTYQPCTSNTVAGNWFGISASTQRLSGALAGVGIVGSSIIPAGASYNVIGGTNAGERNYFGGANTGVGISGTNAQFNRVIGNWIGVGPGGVQMDNNSYGVEIYNASRNQIGGVFTNEGNVISGNQYYGVRIVGTNSFGNVVMGNIIGLDPTASFSMSNRYTGVVVAEGAYSNRIGGTNSATRNVIAGNAGTGISIADANTYGNFVTANLIGVTPSGTRIQNDGYGVDIHNARHNQVGGPSPSEGNVLSGNQWYGAYIRGTGAYANVVEGNIIGLDPTASFVVSNRYQGVVVSGGASSNRIGGSSALRMNVIAGNIYGGIEMDGTNTCWNVVYRNLIGQTTNGVAIPNGTGIEVVDAPNNFIGVNGIGNYVAGNSGRGIYIRGASTNTIVRANYVGLQYPGLAAALPNSSDGLTVSASDVIVGGTNAGDVNYFSGNALKGVSIGPEGTNARVMGNIIGLGTDGTSIISNRTGGISIDAPNVQVGSPEPYGRNIISGNQGPGVDITARGTNATIRNNYIGVDGTGLAAARNTARGILVLADNVTIGGTTAPERNIIAGNQFYGIEVFTGANTRIYGNYIGIGSDGVTNIPNLQRGVLVSAGARAVTIGTTNGSGWNLIAKNANQEIHINNSKYGGHRIEGNFIGVQESGVPFPTADNNIAISVDHSPGVLILQNVIGQNTVGIQLNGTGTFNTVVKGNSIGEYNLDSIANSQWGIQIINSSSNIIGGLTTAERNIIANNFGGIAVTNNGVFVAVANTLAPNLIYSNGTRLNIELGPNGFNANDALDADEGANRLQNSPTLTNAITLFPNAPVAYAQGLLHSTPNTTFAVDIYRSSGTNVEARFHLGRSMAVSDGAGNAPFTVGLPFNVAVGTFFTATATDSEGNTSELSAAPTGAVFKALADADNDQMPDYWEQLYGLNPASSNAVNSDLDGDGVPDLDEYIADTIPNDPNSYLVVTAFKGTATNAVTFPSSPLRRYRLHRTTDPLTSAWVQVSSVYTGQLVQMTLTDTNAPDTGHYRVGVNLP